MKIKLSLSAVTVSICWLLGILVCCAPGGARAADGHWVGTWASGQQLAGALYQPPVLAWNTLRQIVHVSTGGKRLRVRLSNSYGTNAVTMLAVHAALSRSSSSSAIIASSDRALTFQGVPSVTIPPGETVVSDPVSFDLSPMTNVAVSIYFQNNVGNNVTGHPYSLATSYVRPGNDVSEGAFLSPTKTVHWYFLAGIDVLAYSSSHAIVTLGDSITDGYNSTQEANNRWPDDLARRLNTNAPTARVAVMNQGINGNAVVSGGLGPTALARFNRDVLGASGARWLILFEGVNDIGGSSSQVVATNLIAAYGTIIDAAHAKNMLVYGATITPFGGNGYYSVDHEASRQTVNNWIRTSGRFDAVLDFEAAIRDPSNPLNMLPAYDSGDHLHPSVAGYQALANSINLNLFAE